MSKYKVYNVHSVEIGEVEANTANEALCVASDKFIGPMPAGDTQAFDAWCHRAFDLAMTNFTVILIQN